MTTLHAAAALLPEGWAENVRIAIADGAIVAVATGAAAQAGDERHAVVLPAMPNLHSHAFQRAMAGLAETRGPGADSFWSWRETMYRFALKMTPDDVEAVAAQLYVEMLEAGFGRVGEFHYLHHDADGMPYGDPAEMAGRIAAAASATGLGLTLLPVFYAHSGFGGLPPGEGQRRFICDRDLYAKVLDGARRIAAGLDGAVVGVAPHSLRAVTPEELAAAVALSGDGPIHIHAAEQVREVEDCVAWSGERPVEWLMRRAGVDRRWCLVHATHMTGSETAVLAASGAVAGLCPITEANLGDGTFPAPEFLAAGGRFGIGSDSNVLIGVGDELRQLEYSQRLDRRARNVLAAPGGSNGRALFDAALAGGARALGAATGRIEPGADADLVSLDENHPTLAGKRGDAVLDAWIFAGGGRIDCVWTRGKKRVEGGRHPLREAIAARYRRTMTGLAGRA
ncbi:MAG TPA: formimidoylglutamate deiminase [Rhizobiales bacterium]|nr:formimidoylglutamate deiminase [Hyphomicrobiales bacterium]